MATRKGSQRINNRSHKISSEAENPSRIPANLTQEKFLQEEVKKNYELQGKERTGKTLDVLWRIEDLIDIQQKEARRQQGRRAEKQKRREKRYQEWNKRLNQNLSLPRVQALYEDSWARYPLFFEVLDCTEGHWVLLTQEQVSTLCAPVVGRRNLSSRPATKNDCWGWD